MSHHGHHAQDAPQSHESDQVEHEQAQTPADGAEAGLEEGQTVSQR